MIVHVLLQLYMYELPSLLLQGTQRMEMSHVNQLSLVASLPIAGSMVSFRVCVLIKLQLTQDITV